jgi:hypothetical protein
MYIDLTSQTAEVKTHKDFGNFLGGIGLGAKVFDALGEKNAVVFSTGPLSGFFPFASKTSVFFKKGRKLYDLYLGGSLSWRIRFCGIDSIAIYGTAKEKTVVDMIDDSVKFKDKSADYNDLGLPGKRSLLEIMGNVVLDNYFVPVSKDLFKRLEEKNLLALSITGTKTFEIENEEKYNEVYDMVLSKIDMVDVKKSNKPSCAGCPLGCNFSKTGEQDGDFLTHSLVACTFAEEIYSDANIVFACLDSLDYGFTHEDIENFPKLVYDLLEGIRHGG